MSANAPEPDPYQHPCEAMAAPKNTRVFLVMRREDVGGEGEDTWVAGVFSDRDLAVAALGLDRGWITPVPMDTFGRYE